MKKPMKRVLAVMLCLMVVFALVGCGNKEEASTEEATEETTEEATEETTEEATEETTGGDGSLQAVLDRGVLRIGAEGNWQPYVYNDENGELVGFEVEMAAEIAKRLGVEVEEAVSDSWDGVLAGLEADRYDVVICGAGPTPERQEIYEVGNPYGEQLVALVVAADNEEIKDWTDLEGKTAANSLTSSSGNIARSYGAKLVEASLEEAMMLIRDGRADCQVNDAAAINAYMEANPDAGVKIACYYTPENAYETQSAPIIKKGNVDLCNAINEAVAEIIADGTAKELCTKYFGEDFANNVTLYN